MLYLDRHIRIPANQEHRIEVRLGAPARSLVLLGGAAIVGIGAVVSLLVARSQSLPPLELLLGLPAAIVIAGTALTPRTTILAERLTREVTLDSRYLWVFRTGYTLGFEQIAAVLLVRDPRGIHVGRMRGDVWGVALRGRDGGLLKLFYCTDEEKVRRAAAALTRVTGSEIVEWSTDLGRALREERAETFRHKQELAAGAGADAPETSPARGGGRALPPSAAAGATSPGRGLA